MFGRVDLCDFLLEHPTISRFHAGITFVLYFLFFSVLNITLNKNCHDYVFF